MGSFAVVAVNHPCQDNDCTHICVSRRGQRHCSCPQEMILNSNNRTCGGLLRPTFHIFLQSKESYIY